MGKRLINVTKRTTWVLAALSVFAWQTAFALIPFFNPATAHATGVTICHRTNSVKNPYVKITVDTSAVDGQGHDDHTLHTGNVATSELVAQTMKDNKEKWGDIIPDAANDGVGAGLNWVDGKAIYDNNCGNGNTNPTEVIPSPATFKDPTCDEKGSYTIPSVDGIEYLVKGQVVSAGTYEVENGKKVTVNAEASEGYYIADGTTDSWKHKFEEPGDCEEELPIGTITVHKVTDPEDDPTVFSVTADGTGDITGEETQDISTSEDVKYEVTSGTYSVSEAPKTGWKETDNNCSNLVINANSSEASCTIYNTKLATLTIVKDAQPNSSQDFRFKTTGDGLHNFTLDDDGNSDSTYSNTRTFNNLVPGEFSVRERTVDGWQLKNINCEGTTDSWNRAGRTLNVRLAPGDNLVCKFTNAQLNSISGIKFNDVNNDGKYDKETEPGISHWKIKLYKCVNNDDIETDSFTVSNFVQTLSQCTYLDHTFTDSTGAYSFSDLHKGEYKVCEEHRDHWTQTLPGNPECYMITMKNHGETKTDVNFGNHYNVKLNIEKYNDASGPVTDGAVVTYTIKVSVPEDSDTVYNAKVIDVLPDGFEYVANSTTSTYLLTGEPNIIGQEQSWDAGTINPGKFVTITYKAKVTSTVTPGKYTNIAFAQGNDCGEKEQSVSRFSILTDENNNCHQECNVVNSDFVSSDVTVIAPQVLGAYTAGNVLGLVDTGQSLMAIQFALPSIMLLITVLIGASSKRDSKKGAK